MPTPSALNSIIAAFSRTVQTQTEALLADRITLTAWEDAMTVSLKRAHIEAAVRGRIDAGGGLGTDVLNAIAPLRGGIRDNLQNELTFLRGFSEKIAAGELTPAQIEANAQLYANHLQSSYWTARTDIAEQEGATHEARQTQPAEHCDDCLGYEAQGIVPIGTLPAPGFDSVCRANCQCIKIYYRVINGAFVEV